MKFSELIQPDKIYYYEVLPTKDKYEFLKLLLYNTLKKSKYEKNYQEILEALLEREQAMSTGIGGSIAIPHCTTEYVNEIVASLTLLKEELDFQSLDKTPVRIIVLLIISRKNFDAHIKALASVAKTFQNQEIKKNMLEAKSPEEIYEIIKSV
ncbi:MAG: PTS sugar transporter subunit IIA [Leptospiraceae bacterium]|nr:PTS sugar transporter subunit IIA [Leptospiraceae bacterium]MDW7975545.1 PTS sugar transporter subunit IIA [Leptospiraceae bacterium]